MLEQIRKELNKVRLEKNEIAKSAISMLISNIQVMEKKKSPELLTDADIVSCIEKEIKIVTEQIELYKDGDENKEKYSKQKEILKSFLPPQMTKEEVEELVKRILSDKPDNIQGGAVIGFVMKNLTPIINGKFDKKEASEIIRSIV